MNPKTLLRRFLPRSLFRVYHRLLAHMATWRFGRPTRHLIVIGVTGTDGKTTTSTMIASILQTAGLPTGLSSSVYCQVGNERWLNESHMTMPGRFGLQRLLRRMVNVGCKYAVIEVSSEGVAQYRHLGIDFDAAVITNISPEHLESHGSFDAYKQAKGQLFGAIIKSGDKHFGMKKFTVVNLDDPHAEYFLKFWAEEHHGVTIQSAASMPDALQPKSTVWRASDIQLNSANSTFTIDGQKIIVGLPGAFNISNALEAIAVARALGVAWEPIKKALQELQTIPGRLQEVSTGQPWRLVVDYALTPAALEKLYHTLQSQGVKRIISVFGAAGGGRDRWKRPELGKIAAEYAAHIILTTDDPYDEDPRQIAEAIKHGVPGAHQQLVDIVLDRREAIKQAITLAQPGDIIAITGMGAETSMVVKGKKVPWNDAHVVTELLAGLAK